MSEDRVFFTIGGRMKIEKPAPFEFIPKQRVCRVVSNSVTFAEAEGFVQIVQTLKCGAKVECREAGLLPRKRHCDECRKRGMPEANKRYTSAVEAWEKRQAKADQVVKP